MHFQGLGRGGYLQILYGATVRVQALFIRVSGSGTRVWGIDQHRGLPGPHTSMDSTNEAILNP